MVIRNPTLRVGVCHIMRQFFIRQMAGVIIIKVITFFLLGGSCSSWRARYPWTWSRGCTPINSQWRHRVSSCPCWVHHPSSSETTQMVLYCHTAQLVPGVNSGDTTSVSIDLCRQRHEYLCYGCDLCPRTQ
jgi:hypothetical protein